MRPSVTAARPVRIYVFRKLRILRVVAGFIKICGVKWIDSHLFSFFDTVVLATHFDKCRVVVGNRQKNTPKVTCPHCGFIGQKGGAMNLFHFENCPSITGEKRTPNRDYDRTIGTCPHCGFIGSEHGLQSRHYDRCPSLKPHLPKIQCPHCLKEGNDNNYFRWWHFDNCKMRQMTVNNG